MTSPELLFNSPTLAHPYFSRFVEVHGHIAIRQTSRFKELYTNKAQMPSEHLTHLRRQNKQLHSTHLWVITEVCKLGIGEH